MSEWTHFDPSGRARMVDVGEKPETRREATARAIVRMRPETLAMIREGRLAKGDVLAVAQVAGIMGAKKTPDLIPMCHNIPIGSVNAKFTLGDDYVEARCRVAATYRTGVEMEALTGVSVALLTVWDMVKYLEKDERGQYPSTRITDIRVIEKRKEEA